MEILSKLFSQKSKNQSFKSISSISLLSISLLSFHSFSQSQKTDTTKVNQLEEVFISAIRVNKKTPIPFSNLTKKEISERNLGQDIPILMNFMPSVVTTSDAGNGVGYTGIRVRGSDATRVNVTINGIPYNDSEESGTYFVDLPDFASSVQSLQLQRGVGTSTNGAGAFGASLNMQTDTYSEKSSAEISSAMGSFNTFKNTLKFSTGLINTHIEVSGRLSKISSDGYIDRASSELKSYFLQGNYIGKTTLIKALAFGGYEKTYQSWYGVDAETLASDRTFNFAGMYTDANGNTQFYQNQTDNYWQNHYQLHWNEKISTHFNTNLAVHYTKGKGYYEEYQPTADFSTYGLLPISIGGITINSADLITRKWLDNDFYGTTFSANYTQNKFDLIVGGAINKYNGKHFGEVIWSQFASNSTNFDHYYNYFGNKLDGTIFAKINYKLSEKLNLFGDFQYRYVNYKANGVYNNITNDTFNFLNPKAGLSYKINANSQLYFSYAKANKEPNRTDYENGTPKPESLDDFELGWRFAKDKTIFNVNGYYMIYNNQLVLTGALDDVGNPIRTNIGKSYRAGIEVDAAIKFSRKWIIRPNFALSENKNLDFIDENLNHLGTTTIAYSPKIVAGNILEFSPLKNIRFMLLSKYVSQQFLSNIDDENSKLKDYFVQNFNFIYEIKPKEIFNSVTFSLLANNIFNTKYCSNGVDYGGGYVYYFPQATSNFLLGMTVKF